MRKSLYKALILVLMLGAFTSCSDDGMDTESIITIDKNQQVTEFDKWLAENYVEPYNIRVQYRYQDRESDMNFYEVPADYDCSIVMAHLLKYLCLDAYDEVAGVEFTRAYFPKLIVFSGEFKYAANGTMELGSAEGGKKITITGVNRVNYYKYLPDGLNYYYFKTIHHEFTHILNQTKPIPTEFQLVTGTAYVGDQWTSYDETGSWNPTYTNFKRGFITAYAMKEYREDFAEMVATYLFSSKDTWNRLLARGGAEGEKLLREKEQIMKDYFYDEWGIDLDSLRDTILRRETELAAEKVNLTDLTVNK